MRAFYSLAGIKKLVSQGSYRITDSALRGAFSMGFDDEDIAACVVKTAERRDFYKSMAARKFPGLMQDVYKLNYQGQWVYLKVQVSRGGDAVIISFKRDESRSA